jgi:hypothetical protein
MKHPETQEELAAFEKWQRRELVPPQEKAMRIAQMTAQVEALENGDLPEGFVGLERAGVNKILTARIKAKESSE